MAKGIGLSLRKIQKLMRGESIGGTKGERAASRRVAAARGMATKNLPMPEASSSMFVGSNAPDYKLPQSLPASVFDKTLGTIGNSKAASSKSTPPAPEASASMFVGSNPPAFSPVPMPSVGSKVSTPGLNGQTVGAKLPWKAGGYTDAEMSKSYSGVTAVGRTGYDWSKGNELGLPSTNQGYSGFYKAPNGNWYPIDQKKIDDYNSGKGGKGGGGGGGGGTNPAGGSGSYSVEGAPNWWSGILTAGGTPEQQYANNLNAAIPFMSPEDQQVASKYLADNFAEFAIYKNIAYEAPPAEITTGIKEAFWSRDRANQYLNTLTQIMQAMGKTPDQMGAGFVFLQNVGDILSRFGGGAMGTNNLQTREQYQQMLTALDPVLQQAGAEGSASASAVPIANYLYNPTFSAGPLMNLTKNADGTYSFGAPNQQLF